MKRTTYILIGMVMLPFVAILGVILYLRSTAITYDEYWAYLRERHPDWYVEESEGHHSPAVEEAIEDCTDEPDSRRSITINVGSEGIEVLLTSRESENTAVAQQYATDTLIIVSDSCNIRVTSLNIN